MQKLLDAIIHQELRQHHPGDPLFEDLPGSLTLATLIIPGENKLTGLSEIGRPLAISVVRVHLLITKSNQLNIWLASIMMF